MKLKHLQTGKEFEISYHYWTHEFLNKGNHERYLVLDHGDLVAVNQIDNGNQKFLYMLDRDHALRILHNNPHRYTIDEQERTKSDKIYLILQYLVTRSEKGKACFDSEEVACGTGIMPDEAKYLLEVMYKKGYVGNNTAKGEQRRNVFSVSVTTKTGHTLKYGEFSDYTLTEKQITKQKGLSKHIKSLPKFLLKGIEWNHKIVGPIKSLFLVGKFIGGLAIPTSFFVYSEEIKGVLVAIKGLFETP